MRLPTQPLHIFTNLFLPRRSGAETVICSGHAKAPREGVGTCLQGTADRLLSCCMTKRVHKCWPLPRQHLLATQRWGVPLPLLIGCFHMLGCPMIHLAIELTKQAV